jgi:hypothetical protein
MPQPIPVYPAQQAMQKSDRRQRAVVLSPHHERSWL